VNGKGNRDGNSGGREHGDRNRPQGGGSKTSRAPEQTFEEVRYLKYLIDNQIRVCVRLINNEEVSGTIEYYDQSFIRLTREPDPNLFIFKHEIKYLYEV
jgi:host factor-I protein